MSKSAYSVSQNFLTSGKTIAQLLALTDISSSDIVVEIGAGKGHITRALASRCAQVLTYEIDPALCAKLRNSLPQNVRLYQRDFLCTPLPAKPYKVFANIPFNRTTDILHRLTQERHGLESAWLIMEKGAAMRFSGVGQETLSSLTLKPWWNVRIVRHLRREDFHPAPSVDCVLLELRRRAVPDLSMKESAQWQRFVRHGLEKGLRGLVTPRQISAAVRETGIPVSAMLRYVQWLCLFRWSKRR